MREFGLTGGIGSGKSTAAAGLVRRGAVLIDADLIVRELQMPGSPLLTAMVVEFGQEILTVAGELDRQALAADVFADESRLSALNSIVHPAVLAEINERRRVLADTDQTVIVDIPLLVRADGTLAANKGYENLVAVIVVDCPLDVALLRLVEHRDFSELDARARMGNQATREARLEVADFVVDNSGSLADLELQLDICWNWMSEIS